MNALLDLLIQEKPEMQELIELIAPAYPEVDCRTGSYTGWRYPYDEAGRATPMVPLHEGDRFYIKNKTPQGGSCLYA